MDNSGRILYIFFISLSLGNTLFVRKCDAQTNSPEYVKVPASEKYSPAPPLRMIFIGKNYRKEWRTPVTLPVFRMQHIHGGFTIVDSGGGRQTNSLRLKDKSGFEWTLRSVDKDVEKSIFPILRNTMAETLMQDLQSAIHPYAALTVPTLAKAVGVIVAQPKLYFIPDDPELGEYRSLFANTVCFLEEREPTPDNSETKSSNNVLEKISEETDHRLMQLEILKARLLDMLIGDWDRHADQWRWGENDSSGINYYYPIPRDRDFAYFNPNGLFMIVASRVYVPYMKGFGKSAAGLKRLNSKVLALDGYWLNELTSEDWKITITNFQQKLTDSVIIAAIKHLPHEVYKLGGENLIMKLISRRNGLMKHAMNYYEFLATRPIITGTDNNEWFTITKEGKGICVTVRRRAARQENDIVYQRIFNPRDTKQIRMEGLGGNDNFEVDENVSSPIKLYLEGGDGEDHYSVKGKIRARTDQDKKTTGTKSGLASK